MKRFIFQISFLSIAVLVSIAFVLGMADGHADAYYLKFTTPRQSNLILGNSKAAQGIQPSKLHDILDLPLYNYAFSNMVSPYGPIYFNSIQQKVDSSTKNGLFILTVDPWSICSISENPNDSTAFRELHSCTDLVQQVSQNPNYSYLLKSFNGNYFNVLLKNGPAEVMKDGWLNVTLNDDAYNNQRRTEFTLNEYEEKRSTYKLSTLRLNYLNKTIKFLSQYGDVRLVRLPIHPQLMKIESELMPNFNNSIRQAINSSGGYYDMTNQNAQYQYTDGVHLTKSSGAAVSQSIGYWINRKQNE